MEKCSTNTQVTPFIENNCTLLTNMNSCDGQTVLTRLLLKMDSNSMSYPPLFFSELTCCPSTPFIQPATETRSTPYTFSEYGDCKGLQNQSIDCSGDALLSYQLENNGQGEYHYVYRCGKIIPDQSSPICTSYYTDDQPMDSSVDAQWDLSCQPDEYLSQFKLESGDENQVRYQYTCCKKEICSYPVLDDCKKDCQPFYIFNSEKVQCELCDESKKNCETGTIYPTELDCRSFNPTYKCNPPYGDCYFCNSGTCPFTNNTCNGKCEPNFIFNESTYECEPCSRVTQNCSQGKIDYIDKATCQSANPIKCSVYGVCEPCLSPDDCPNSYISLDTCKQDCKPSVVWNEDSQECEECNPSTKNCENVETLYPDITSCEKKHPFQCNVYGECVTCDPTTETCTFSNKQTCQCQPSYIWNETTKLCVPCTQKGQCEDKTLLFATEKECQEQHLSYRCNNPYGVCIACNNLTTTTKWTGAAPVMMKKNGTIENSEKDSTTSWWISSWQGILLIVVFCFCVLMIPLLWMIVFKKRD